MNNNNSRHNLIVGIVVFILAFLLFKSCGGCLGCTGCGAFGCASGVQSCIDEGNNIINNGGSGNTDADSSPAVTDYGITLTAKSELYINDYTDSLTEADKSSIVRMGEQLDKNYGVQLVAVVIKDGDLLSNDAISDFAYRLFNQWGIGDSNKNNGLLLVINTAQSSYIGNAYCVEGTGLESLLPASELGEIINEHVLPNLDERRFAQAATEGYMAFAERLTEIYGGTDAEL